MMCSRQTAFSLVTIYGIAVFAILRKSYLRNAANKKDIISKLPDDILISIISFMPIKDGIRTSVLSKRWRNLYNFVSNIDTQCDYLVGRRCAPSPHDYDVIINGRGGDHEEIIMKRTSQFRSTNTQFGPSKGCWFLTVESSIVRMVLGQSRRIC
ncbi:hypothetical protein Pfo_021075 [Paulownia fortunei]|nr:hypothetical protein Pfo_021075 [Paulownia fortunei]